MKRAVALQYEAAVHDAPVVVSAGEGDLAERIERAARQWGVPIVHDVTLAMALSELAIGEAIPEALYESIAAILSELAGPPDIRMALPARGHDR
jgi:flagellar biosynthesis protein